MKKFILLIALSALFYSAPGHAGKKGKKAAASEAAVAPAEAAVAPAEALAEMKACVTNLEKQATTFCNRLVIILQLMEEDAYKVLEEVYTTQKRIGDGMLLNPAAQLPSEPSDPSDPTKRKILEQESAIAKRALNRVRYAELKKEVAIAAEASAHTYLDELLAISSAEREAERAAARALRPGPRDTEYGPRDQHQVLVAREAEREAERAAAREAAREAADASDPEMCVIAEKRLGERREMLAEMERAHGKRLKEEIRYVEKEVKEFLHIGQGTIQRSFEDVKECYAYFEKGTAAPSASAWGRAWERANALVGVVNKTAEEMWKECSGNIDCMKEKQAEEELRQQQEAEAAAAQPRKEEAPKAAPARVPAEEGELRKSSSAHFPQPEGDGNFSSY